MKAKVIHVKEGEEIELKEGWEAVDLHVVYNPDTDEMELYQILIQK